MERTQENIVSSYFYYMWNYFGSKEECAIVFSYMSDHFWSKWCAIFKENSHGAAERFYAELSTDNRKKLVDRACEVYNGACKNQNNG